MTLACGQKLPHPFSRTSEICERKHNLNLLHKMRRVVRAAIEVGGLESRWFEISSLSDWHESIIIHKVRHVNANTRQMIEYHLVVCIRFALSLLSSRHY